MPIPDYQTLFRPVLVLAANSPLSRQSATREMSDLFNLTSDERQSRIPSGSATYIRNRVGWAMTYLTKAGLIHKVAPKMYEATDRGREFLKTHTDGFSNVELSQIEEFQQFKKFRRERSESAVETTAMDATILTSESTKHLPKSTPTSEGN